MRHLRLPSTTSITLLIDQTKKMSSATTSISDPESNRIIVLSPLVSYIPADSPAHSLSVCISVRNYSENGHIQEHNSYHRMNDLVASCSYFQVLCEDSSFNPHRIFFKSNNNLDEYHGRCWFFRALIPNPEIVTLFNYESFTRFASAAAYFGHTNIADLYIGHAIMDGGLNLNIRTVIHDEEKLKYAIRFYASYADKRALRHFFIQYSMKEPPFLTCTQTNCAEECSRNVVRSLGITRGDLQENLICALLEAVNVKETRCEIKIRKLKIQHAQEIESVKDQIARALLGGEDVLDQIALIRS
jgi:hypothetical protein